MKPLTPFEIRIIANMTEYQLERACDSLLAIERPWTAPEVRAAVAFANEHCRRMEGLELFRH